MKKFTEEDIKKAYEFGEKNDKQSLYNLITKDELINGAPDMSIEAIQKRKNEIKLRTEIANKAWEDANNEGDDNEKAYWIHGFLSGNHY